MSKRRIAVIDDDPLFLNLMEEFLNELGYDAVLWMNSSRAGEMIRREGPDLVMLDLLFGREPLGLSLLEEVRAAPALGVLPVIVCSAARHLLRERADELTRLSGAIILKPLRLDDLEATMTTLLVSPDMETGYGF